MSRSNSPLFVPLMAGASLRDRLIACLGALACIAATSAAFLLLPPATAHLPLLVAPLGASAVLLFAVPTSPLAQPWAIVGGNTVSALVGVVAAWAVPQTSLAAGLAVSGAILAMSLLRCLHPPGGAAALTAVIGGPAVTAAGFVFPFMPVALNSLLLVALGWCFHRFSGHSYPHRAATPPAAVPLAIEPGDIDRALEEAGEPFDVAREDLQLLFRRAEAHAQARREAARIIASSRGRQRLRQR